MLYNIYCLYITDTAENLINKQNLFLIVLLQTKKFSLKEAVWGNSIDPSCKDVNARFTTKPLNPLSDIVVFLGLKLFHYHNSCFPVS